MYTVRLVVHHTVHVLDLQCRIRDPVSEPTFELHKFQ
jgi:hypothetical protein